MPPPAPVNYPSRVVLCCEDIFDCVKTRPICLRHVALEKAVARCLPWLLSMWLTTHPGVYRGAVYVCIVVVWVHMGARQFSLTLTPAPAIGCVRRALSSKIDRFC